MTIRPGQRWGSSRPLPHDGVVCATDAEACDVVTRARRAGRKVPTLGLIGGDLWRTLGAPQGGAARLRSDIARSYPVDLGAALADGRQLWFVAHLVARRSWLSGPIWAACNAEFLGKWDVAPRGHPNDGQLDVIEADPSLADRLKALRRLPTGRRGAASQREASTMASGIRGRR